MTEPKFQNTRETETQGTKKEPFVFDLNNDGELSVTSSENRIYFDYKQDGFLEKTPWAAQGDGHNLPWQLISGTEIISVPIRTPSTLRVWILYKTIISSGTPIIGVPEKASHSSALMGTEIISVPIAFH